MKLQRILMAAAAIAATACGTDPAGSGGSLQDYQETGAAMSAAVEVYAVEAAELPDDATCARVHAGYDATMTRLRDRLREDCDCLGTGDQDRDRERARDASCVTDAIAAELQLHAGVACAADPAGDQAEAARHVRTMTQLLAHQRVRLQEAACTGEGGEAEPTFTCRRTGDGGFELDGARWEPGTEPGPCGHDPAAPWPELCGDGTCGGCGNGG